MLHDGYSDLLYVLLPLWQAEFGLAYATVGFLRMLYAGAMAGFQVPAGLLSERIGERALLALGTALAAAGFVVAGVSTGFWLLGAGLVLGGLGSSVQHPLASTLISRAFDGSRSRAALGTYNFAGDIGKMLLPAATAALLTLLAWRPTVLVLSVVGLAGAAAILLLPRLPPKAAAPAAVDATAAGMARGAAGGRGFPLLLGIGVIDSAARMGFLTFLPFLLTQKGAGLPTIGVALTLVFAGGAVGKLACGLLGARLGVLRTVIITEGGTAVGILALLPLPLEAALALLPLIGVALNGTSSVLYGTVPELVTPERRARAFSVFYTGAIGGGAVAPVVFGLFSDVLGVPTMMALVAGVVMLTLPLAWLLRPTLLLR
ncbi:MAG: MFS transporter [Proteobacteria bacterium]|nr:MFS transporter [Pseudomonadota bacterium]